jgi:hypothetical protein
MSNKSEVARLLLNGRHPNEILAEDHPNYIGVATADKNKISYLSSDRINSIAETDGNFWHTSKRTFAKPGTFIKKIFKDVSEREIENFSTLYKNYQSIESKPEFTFSVVSGEDIRKYYYYETYSDQSSSLGNSCMKHRSCQDFMDIYCMNKNIKMLIMLDRYEKLIGRAILWEGVMKHDDFSKIMVGPYKIMDRIYTTNDEKYAFHFRKWADDNGFVYKKEQKWNSTLLFQSNESDSLMKLSLKLDNTDLRRFPYMDTFKFLCFDNSTVYNFKPTDVVFKTISAANGGYENADFLELDGYNNTYGYRHDMVFLTYKNYWTSGNNVRHSGVNDCYILRDDSVRHDELEDWVFINYSLNNLDAINEQLVYMRKEKAEREERIAKQREEMRIRQEREEARIRERDAQRESQRQSHPTETTSTDGSRLDSYVNYWDEFDYIDPHGYGFGHSSGSGRSSMLSDWISARRSGLRRSGRFTMGENTPNESDGTDNTPTDTQPMAA